MSRAPPVRPASVVALLLLASSLTACGGGGDREIVSAPVVTQPPLAPTGTLVVTVNDPHGKPLRGAEIHASSGVRPLGSATTGADGRATMDGLPRLIQLIASHPLGSQLIQPLEVSQGGITSLDVTVRLFDVTTVALLPATIPADGISVDRTELNVQVTLVSPAFVSALQGLPAGASLPTPLVALDNCYVWLDATRATPSCSWPSPDYQTTSKVKSVTSYHYDPVGSPALSLTGQPYSAMLLLEQSGRQSDSDPYALRSYAARQFIRSARTAPSPDLIAIAGFAGSGGTAGSPPLIPQLPLWVPPGATTVFSADRAAQDAAVEILEPLVGGSAPVFAALSSAMTTIAAQVLAPRQHAVVALLGGGDDSDVSAPQRQAALASLRQQQADTGTQFVLIAGPIDDTSPQRDDLAELAATLRAPIIYAGYPANWIDRSDGMHTAVELAADLLAGTPLQTVQAVFRLKSDQPGGFVSGSLLRGVLYVESSSCPMGCWELPLNFAVTVP